MSTNCVFEFDRPEPIYYSGETIRGRVVLTTAKVKNVRAVQLTIDGVAKVRWRETKRTGSGKNSHTRRVTYRGDQKYLHSKTVVFGEGNLPIGTHIYTFESNIPPGFPTTCCGEYGRIMYTVALKLDRPFRFDNVFTQHLTVVNQLDLNRSPEYLIPLKTEEMKVLCCWFCASDPIRTEVTTPFGGYALGQEIPVQLLIDNMTSGNDVSRSFVRLRQEFTFTSQEPIKKIRVKDKNLGTVELGGALRLTKKLYEAKIVIPSVPPTSTDLSCIVQVKYFIVVEIELGTLHSNSVTTVPITIGTVPLQASLGNATAPTDDLPTYEEATDQDRFSDSDNGDEGDKTDFIPKYPVYNNFFLPTAPSFEDDDNDC